MHRMMSSKRERSLLPAESAVRVAAAVEGGHGFVGRSCLQLHEVRAQVFALRALLVRLLSVLPRLLVREHFVHLLHDWVLAADDALADAERVGTRGTRKLVPLASLLQLQQDTTRGTEQEHRRPASGASGG